MTERNEAMVARVAAGLASLDEIAADYGISKQRVSQIAHRAGIRRNHIPRPAAPRLGLRETCKRCGIKYPTGRIHEHAVAADHALGRCGRLRPSELALMAEGYKRGLGYVALADVFKVHFQVIKYHIRRSGLTPHATGERPLDYPVVHAIKAELAERRAQMAA